MSRGTIDNAINEGKGILRLVPDWIPRTFNKPGKRLRLHPDDYLGFGIERGFIEERWLSATNTVQLGASDPEEGLSFIDFDDNRSTLRDAVQQLGAELIGDELWNKYGRFPVFSKFYDYYYPSFLHVHHMKEEAERVGCQPKPEHYYFAPQMNVTTLGTRPSSFFGFNPDTKKEDIKNALRIFGKDDNHLIEYSRGWPLKLGTGWFTPAGVLHSTGSLCTYEPQWCSDVSSIWQNVDESLQRYGVDYLYQYVPEDKADDLDYIFSVVDWEANTDPNYREKYFRMPIVISDDLQHTEKWVAYGTGNLFGAKELTIKPGETFVSKDIAAYGCIWIQGHGKFGVYDAESAQMLRFGQTSQDEYFVSENAAKDGVKIVNKSKSEPIVILKHFANNCGVPEKSQV